MRIGYAVVFSLALHGVFFALLRWPIPAPAGGRGIAPIELGDPGALPSGPAKGPARRLAVRSSGAGPVALGAETVEPGLEGGPALPQSSGPGMGSGSGTATFGQLLGWGNAPPEYPREALERGWEGTVRLALIVDDAGAVQKVEIIASSGHAILDEAAVRAAREWRVPPESRFARVVVPVQFKLVGE